jgi:hypothetical protein
MTILELRFPSPKVKVEDFILDDPAALVVDLSRADIDAAYLTSAAGRRFSRTPSTQGGAPTAAVPDTRIFPS